MLERSPRRTSRLLMTMGVLLVACQSGPPPNEGSTEAPPPVSSPDDVVTTAELREPNTLEGIYTPAQAARGRQVFENICSECHKTEEWQDDGFRARWNGESVYRFWFYIYEQMPNGSPPYSLPRDQVSDVLTYILELNGLPPGDAELGSDDDSIDQHWLYWGTN